MPAAASSFSEKLSRLCSEVGEATASRAHLSAEKVQAVAGRRQHCTERKYCRGLGETRNTKTNPLEPRRRNTPAREFLFLRQGSHPAARFQTGERVSVPTAFVHLPTGRGALHRSRKRVCTPAKLLCAELSPEIRRSPYSSPWSLVRLTWERVRDGARRPRPRAPLLSRAPRAQCCRIRAANRNRLPAAAATAAAASAPVTA